nr:unnamed protein product [Callosobruchus chinensis]
MIFREDFETRPGFEKCVKSSGVDVSTIYDKTVSPEKLCFGKCMAEEKGFVRADGTMDPDALFDAEIIEKLTPEELAGVEPMKECLKTIVIKKCEDIQEFVKCSKASFADA